MKNVLKEIFGLVLGVRFTLTVPILCFVILGSQPAKGDENKYPDCSKFSTPEAKKSCENSVINALNQQTNPSEQTNRKACDDAIKDLKDLYKPSSDFSKACKANKSSDVIECLKAADLCQTCTGLTQDSKEWSKNNCSPVDEDEEDIDEEDFDGMGNAFLPKPEEMTRGKKPTANADEVSRVRDLLNYCPIEPAGELKAIHDTYKEQKETKEDLEKRKQELEEDLANNQIEFGEVSAELYGNKDCMKKGIGPGHPNYNDQCAGIDEKLNLELASLTKEYSERAAKQFQQINDQIREVAIAMQGAKAQLFEEETGIMKDCHARGVAAITAEQERRKKRLGSSSLSVNGFASVSDLKSLNERYSQIGLDAYNSCLKKDEQIKRRLAAVREMARLKQEGIQAQMDKLLRLQKETMDKMVDSKKDPELGKALTEARKTSASRKKDLEKRYAQLEAKIKSQINELKKIETELYSTEVAFQTALEQKKLAREKGLSATNKDNEGLDRSNLILSASDFRNTATLAQAKCCVDGLGEESCKYATNAISTINKADEKESADGKPNSVSPQQKTPSGAKTGTNH